MQNKNIDITSAGIRANRRGAIFFIALLSFFQIVMGFFLITGGGNSLDMASANDLDVSANIILTDIQPYMRQQ